MVLCVLLMLGCQTSNHPGSYNKAAIRLDGQPFERVREVTTQVFSEEGFRLKGETPQRIDFERPGNRRDALKWGNWDSGVAIRAKVNIRQLDIQSWLLECDAVAVRSAGDAFFEEENPMLLSWRPYQRILDKVEQRLVNSTATR